MTALAIVFLPVAAGYIKCYSIPLSSAAGIYGCFLLFLFYLVAPAMPAGRLLFGKVITRKYKALIVIGLFAAPYFFYAAGTGDFHWLGLVRLVAIAAPVALLYSVFAVRDQAKFSWQDMLVAAWLVSAVLFHWVKGVWNVPVNLDFMGRLFVVSLGVFAWTYLRPVPDLGYHFTLHTRVLPAAGVNLFFFAVIAIPLSLLLGFTMWNPRWQGFGDFAISYLEIFLFIALLEELFFRGFLQNLLSKSFHSWWAGQLVASCIFGLFHIVHAPFPNWRYVALASIAGWFYGSAYRSGGLLSSALLHAMVDTLWREFLTRG